MLCSEQSCVDDGQLLSGVCSNHVQRVLPFTTDSPGEEYHNDFILNKKNGVLWTPLITGILEEQCFLVHFQLGIIFKKKKKKKTWNGLMSM